MADVKFVNIIRDLSVAKTSGFNPLVINTCLH
jgi:hypothetical protein